MANSNASSNPSGRDASARATHRALKPDWQMSRTPVIQQALSNAWLKEQGLLSVKDLWCKAQGYTAKRKGKASSSVPAC